MTTNPCCDLGEVEDVVDYSVHLGSARPFLERAGILPTHRGPRPRIQPGRLRIHDAPLQPPLPIPAMQEHLNGSPPPDRGVTTEWPHPSLEET